VLHGLVFVGRAARMSIAVVLAVGSVAYVGIRTGGGTPRAEATTPPPTIYIPHNARLYGYTTRRLTIHKGQTVRVVNHDSMRHTVTSRATDSHHQPLFSKTVSGGARGMLATSKLAPGTYRFYCQFHPNMTGTLIVKGSGGGTTGSAQTFNQPLRIPKVITSSHPSLAIERAQVRVFAKGPRTWMWTYGGTYPAPTIRRPAGQDTKVTFSDKLNQSFSVHLHGDHHESRYDGQPTRYLVSKGHPYTYDYPLTDGGQPERAGFFYYHDHRMLETGRNNWMGLQGMFIVDDNAAEGQLGLPSGGYDVPVMVSDRSFTAKHQLKVPFPAHPMMEMTGPNAPPNDNTIGNTILVNGAYSPYLNVATHRYRLRLLNMSNFQSYDFELSDGRSFTQIGSGDSLLPNPVVRKDILLGPAQRADIVVNFGGELHKRILLKSVPRVNRPKAGIGTPSASLMQFRVTRAVSDGSGVPSALRTPPTQVDPATLPISKTWTVDKHVGHNSHGYFWRIDGKMFDPNVSNYSVKLGTTQKWRLVNDSDITHYLHIHEEQWQTILRDGKAPPAWELGLQDTWRLDPGESVVVEGKFADYTGRFMIHCHMLDHEDHGLMAQFTVVR
jgi:spore coat protein A